MTLPPHLPVLDTTRIAVKVTNDALRQIRGGHPWVFDASITSLSRDGQPGDLAVIFGDRRQFVAIGLYDPASPIRIRILHHGSPATVDRSFWAERVDRALQVRAELIASPATNGFRCLNGENDGFSGLVLDRYDTTLVLKLYSEVWIPHLATLLAVITEQFERAGLATDRVVLRLSRQLSRTETFGLRDGMTIWGEAPQGPVAFTENGLVFEADVVGGQKTGHFLDQRENRARVKAMSKGRRVLDVFACTGGFSLHAAAGGATEVISIDMSQRSLNSALRNFALNRDRPLVERCRHQIVVGDAFDEMRRLISRREEFDLVIVDPPSFAQKRRDRDGALEAYRRLTDLGLALTARGGSFVQSSCSSRVDAAEFRHAVLDTAYELERPMAVTAETGHAVDHPVTFPQGAYLKTLFTRLDRRPR